MRRAVQLSHLAPIISARPVAGRRCLASFSRSTTPASRPPMRTSIPHATTSALHVRNASSGTAAVADAGAIESRPDSPPDIPTEEMIQKPLKDLPSPPVSRSLSSAKLAALHSRLSLPKRLPLQTLARTLVNSSADPNPDFNNSSLEILGSDLLGYYVSEHIVCHYPRIPMSALFSAQAAYVGPKALAVVAREWGIESVAEPGGEVDPGLLQYRRLPPGFQIPPVCFPNTGDPADSVALHRRVSTRIVYDDQFGDMKTGFPTSRDGESFMTKRHARAPHDPPQPIPESLGNTTRGVTNEDASSSFVRALVGAIYVHCGRVAAHRFIAAHFLSRSLDIASLFDFRKPTLDLAILCAREGFEPPVARLLSETGRLSRHPVFVVGIFSGQDKLGEGAGSSLLEARTRAATAALASWYLYSPLDVTVPSETEESKPRRWIPNHIDPGEIFR